MNIHTVIANRENKIMTKRKYSDNFQDVINIKSRNYLFKYLAE